MDSILTTPSLFPAPRRRRGGQPGNLNALKYLKARPTPVKGEVSYPFPGERPEDRAGGVTDPTNGATASERSERKAVAVGFKSA